ncbi:GGDEF domain-containing protein [Myxococcaceae bacterium GXIMD 01537]
MKSLTVPSPPAQAPAWLWNGDEPRVAPVFQPIVDLLTGEAIGYEVLSRGLDAHEAPGPLFHRARTEGVSWELERACWTAAVRRIAQLPREERLAPFFFNVSPDVLKDPRFNDGSTLELLRSHGLQPGHLVLEITETAVFEDPEQLEELRRLHAEHGFGIALDDFGAGHSGLVTLVHSSPDFIKLDQALVRDIQRHAYRQHLVRSLVTFAASVDTTLIAEGVETWEELTMLLRLGVRYAQGFLVARPASVPPRPDAAFEQRRREALLELSAHESENTVGGLVIRGAGVEAPATREALEALFRREPSLDHVVTLSGGVPRALVTRQAFYEGAAESKPLVVEDSLSLTALARRALEREPDEVYDPVVVTDREGRFLGTVTMKQLIGRATELESLAASGVHPLTHLPGHRMVERWLRQAPRTGALCVISCGLSHLREYNERQGYLRGDRLLRLTARVLSEGLPSLPAGSHLGHLGGDDFVLVCPGEVRPEVLETLCRRFDTEKRVLFEHEDLERGYFESVDRRGRSVRVPLVTLELAALDRQQLGPDVHLAAVTTRAGSLMKKVKQLSGRTHASAFMFERRTRPQRLRG